MKNEQETLALISNAEIHKWPIKTPHSLIPLRQYFETQTHFLYIQLRFFCFVSNIYRIQDVSLAFHQKENLLGRAIENFLIAETPPAEENVVKKKLFLSARESTAED